jgi:DNA-binding XRE family transcriptional regulator
LSALDFFILDTYQDSKNETRPRYLITKKGCDMIANKMIGEKGVLFTAVYVTKFEEMEKTIKGRTYKKLSFKQEHDHLKLTLASVGDNPLLKIKLLRAFGLSYNADVSYLDVWETEEIAKQFVANPVTKDTTKGVTNNEFGNYIKELRIKAGYESRESFAKASGISAPSIMRIEKRRHYGTVNRYFKKAGCILKSKL